MLSKNDLLFFFGEHTRIKSINVRINFPRVMVRYRWPRFQFLASGQDRHYTLRLKSYLFPFYFYFIENLLSDAFTESCDCQKIRHTRCDIHNSKPTGNQLAKS